MTGHQIALAFDAEEENLESVETGIPQGFPTSPILFIIYFTFGKLRDPRVGLVRLQICSLRS